MKIWSVVASVFHLQQRYAPSRPCSSQFLITYVTTLHVGRLQAVELATRLTRTGYWLTDSSAPLLKRDFRDVSRMDLRDAVRRLPDGRVARKSIARISAANGECICRRYRDDSRFDFSLARPEILVGDPRGQVCTPSRRSFPCELIEILQPTHSRPPVSEPDVLPVLAEFTALSTAEGSDVLDHLGLPGSVLGIAPIGSHARTFDRTLTVRHTPVDLEPSTSGDHIERTGWAA
jgi:hypothetical protein